MKLVAVRFFKGCTMLIFDKVITLFEAAEYMTNTYKLVHADPTINLPYPKGFNGPRLNGFELKVHKGDTLLFSIFCVGEPSCGFLATNDSCNDEEKHLLFQKLKSVQEFVNKI